VARSTLQSVARHAAVSRQTVSNAINAPHLVAPETLDRVRAAIAELHYRPHQAARTLRTRRSYLVGVRIDPPVPRSEGDGAAVADASVLDRFLHALTDQARHCGYGVLAFAASDDTTEMVAYEELLGDYNLDAFVLTGTHFGDRRTAWLCDRDVPFVTFGRPWGAPDDLDGPRHWVDVDGAAGTRAATEHLLAMGHERIAWLGWPAGSGAGDDRRSGWASALTAAGLTPADARRPAVAVTDRFDLARAAAGALLERAQRPTAVVCASDTLALGVWSELLARGAVAGRDLAVVGFDDTPTAAAVGLTSVAQPVAEVATRCLRQLQDVLGTAAPTSGLPGPSLLAPRLVFRASTSANPTSPADPPPSPTKGVRR